MAEFITFDQNTDEKKVRVTIQTGENYQIFLYYDCENVLYGRLLRSHLTRERDRLIEEFGKSLYMEGYRDGRSKKAKKSWFPTRLSYRFKPNR